MSSSASLSVSRRFAAAKVAVVVALTGVASAAAPMVGAPLICFPITLEDAARLPFAAAADSTTPTVSIAELPRMLATLFATSADVELHMEALRRSAIACGGDSHRDGPADRQGDSPRDAPPWQALLSALDSAVVAAELAPESDPDRAARLARAWFDVGYAREVGATMGLCRARGLGCFERAIALAPDHPAIHFGAAMANFQSARLERHSERGGASPAAAEIADAADGVWCRQLGVALVAPTPQLRRNLLATFGAYLDCDTDEELRAACRRERGAR